jgi:hypothetical protein
VSDPVLELVRRLTHERDEARAEVQRLRAVVEAARSLREESLGWWPGRIGEPHHSDDVVWVDFLAKIATVRALLHALDEAEAGRE